MTEFGLRIWADVRDERSSNAAPGSAISASFPISRLVYGITQLLLSTIDRRRALAARRQPASFRAFARGGVPFPAGGEHIGQYEVAERRPFSLRLRFESTARRGDRGVQLA